MADVEIKYNNATIASLSDSGTEVLETNGTYLTDDIAVEYTKPTPNLQSKTTTPTTSSRTITADSGYDGLSQVTVNAISPIKAAQTYTPTTTNQIIQPGRWLTGAQTIKGDANLVASNIKKDVQIFGVTGSYEGGGGGVEVDTCTINISTMHNSTIWATRIVDNTIVTSIVEPEGSTSYTIQDVVCGSYMYVQTCAYILTGFSSTNGSSHVFENYINTKHMIQVTSASTDTISLWDDD